MLLTSLKEEGKKAVGVAAAAATGTIGASL